MEQKMNHELNYKRAILNVLLKEQLIDDVEYADTLSLIIRKSEKDFDKEYLIS